METEHNLNDKYKAVRGLLSNTNPVISSLASLLLELVSIDTDENVTPISSTYLLKVNANETKISKVNKRLDGINRTLKDIQKMLSVMNSVRYDSQSPSSRSSNSKNSSQSYSSRSNSIPSISRKKKKKVSNSRSFYSIKFDKDTTVNEKKEFVSMLEDVYDIGRRSLSQWNTMDLSQKQTFLKRKRDTVSSFRNKSYQDIVSQLSGV